MPVTWGDRLREKLEELRWSSRDLAERMIAAGRDTDTITGKTRTLKSLTQNIEKYRPGGVGQPRGSMIADIAATLGVSENWLRTGEPEPSHNRHGATPTGSNVRPAPAPRQGGAVIPIRGLYMAGESGVLTFSVDDQDVVGHIDAPAELMDVPDAYAAYVVGDSMEPAYSAGQLVCINPHLPARPGNDVILRVTDDGDVTVAGYLKRLVSVDEKQVKVKQFNPEKILTFKRERVVAMHCVAWHQVR